MNSYMDVFIIAPNALNDFKEERQFRQYANSHADKTKLFKQSGRLNQGDYYIILKDPNLGILSSSTSDIAVKAKFEP
jgi:hypothetical protein